MNSYSSPTTRCYCPHKYKGIIVIIFFHRIFILNVGVTDTRPRLPPGGWWKLPCLLLVVPFPTLEPFGLKLFFLAHLSGTDKPFPWGSLKAMNDTYLEVGYQLWTWWPLAWQCADEYFCHATLPIPLWFPAHSNSSALFYQDGEIWNFFNAVVVSGTGYQSRRSPSLV